MQVTVDEKAKKVTIVMPIDEFESASGKSSMVASTRGNKTTDVKYKGKPLVVSVNAYTAK